MSNITKTKISHKSTPRTEVGFLQPGDNFLRGNKLYKVASSKLHISAAKDLTYAIDLENGKVIAFANESPVILVDIEITISYSTIL